MPDEACTCGPEGERSRRYRAVPASPTEVPQVLFVRPQIGYAGGKFAQTDDAALLPAQIACGENAQAFPHNLRRTPTQFADEHCQSLSRRAIQARLNCRAHFSLDYKIESV